MAYHGDSTILIVVLSESAWSSTKKPLGFGQHMRRSNTLDIRLDHMQNRTGVNERGGDDENRSTEWHTPIEDFTNLDNP